MTALDLLALALATTAALDAWLDEDSILAELRARTQLWRSGFWRTLANCRFCLSYWVPAGLVGLTLGALAALPAAWADAARLPVYCLAATAAARLIARATGTGGGGAATFTPEPPDDSGPEPAAPGGPPADVP